LALKVKDAVIRMGGRPVTFCERLNMGIRFNADEVLAIA
jgi:hypothetical protein